MRPIRDLNVTFESSVDKVSGKVSLYLCVLGREREERVERDLLWLLRTNTPLAETSLVAPYLSTHGLLFLFDGTSPPIASEKFHTLCSPVSEAKTGYFFIVQVTATRME